MRVRERKRIVHGDDRGPVRRKPHPVPGIPDRIHFQAGKIARRDAAPFTRSENSYDVHAVHAFEAFERQAYYAAHAATVGFEVERVNPEIHFANCGNRSSRMSENALKAPCVIMLAQALFVFA